MHLTFRHNHNVSVMDDSMSDASDAKSDVSMEPSFPEIPYDSFPSPPIDIRNSEELTSLFAQHFSLSLTLKMSFTINGNYEAWYSSKASAADVYQALQSHQTPDQSGADKTRPIESIQYTVEQYRHLEKMFSAQFEDEESLANFLWYFKKISGLWTSVCTQIAPYTAIVQSSGTGKSRIATEAGSKCFVFYICFRDKKSSGYPVRSHVCDYLVSSQAAGPAFYIFFFVACFEHLKGNIDMLALSLDPFSAWRDQQLAQTLDSRGVPVSIGDQFWDPIMKRTKTLLGTRDLASDKTLLTASRLLAKTFQSLNQKIKGSAFQWTDQQLTLFVIDEARELLDKCVKDERPLFYDFRRAISHFPFANKKNGLSLFCVMLDTLGQISTFLPNNIAKDSARFYNNRTELFFPFYALPFVNQDGIFWFVQNGQLVFNVEEIYRLFSLNGRRLFSQMYTRDGDTQNQRFTEIIQLAALKLLGIAAPNQKITEEGLLALATCRLCLNFHASSSVPEALIRSHLAFCCYVSPDRKVVIADYPSEPVVSLAASFAINSNSYLHANWENLMEVLMRQLKTGMVENGYRGELVARILFLRAWDQATKDTNPVDSQPIPVSLFLDSFSKLVTPEINRCKVSDSRMQGLLDGYVFFTHFIYVTFTQGEKDLEKNFALGAAIICKRCREAIDLIIPVLLQTGRMSYISVQVKNYSKDSNQPAADMLSYMSAGKLEFIKDVPFLTLLLCFGWKEETVEALNIGSNFDMETRNSRRKDPGALIKISGLSKKVYTGLTDGLRVQLEELLTGWKDAVGLSLQTDDYDMKKTMKSVFKRSYVWESD